MESHFYWELKTTSIPLQPPTGTAHGAFRLFPSSSTAQLWAQELFSLLSPGSGSYYLKGPHGVTLNSSLSFSGPEYWICFGDQGFRTLGKKRQFVTIPIYSFFLHTQSLFLPK